MKHLLGQCGMVICIIQVEMVVEEKVQEEVVVEKVQTGENVLVQFVGPGKRISQHTTLGK